MDQEKLISFSKGNILALIIAGIGILLVLLGLIQVFQNSSENSNLVFEQEEVEEASTVIIVDIQGAVIKPGVYEMEAGERFVDVLALAGGLSEEADRDWVEKNLNLAKKVTDGVKIYIPRVGERVLSNELGATSTGTGGPVININTASKSDLESLSGVGPVTADKIIDGRPFSNIDELLSSKIVGNSTFNKIKDKIAAN